MSGLRSWIPRWWNGDAGGAGRIADLLLAPAEGAYRISIDIRNAAYDHGWRRSERAPIPVISVGNLAVGGTGKTPVAAYLAARLHALGARPGIGLRGYGVDETELHRELNPDVPVFADPRRIRGARTAARSGCGVLVMDDGFQHRALARDLDILLIAAERWTDRPRLLPRGPWRERATAATRADLILITRKTASAEEVEAVAMAVRRSAPAATVARADLLAEGLVPLHPNGEPPRLLEKLAERRVLAVCALADPSPFITLLRQTVGDVEAFVYPDHHRYREADVERLLRHLDGRVLVTTAKDAVKLRPLVSPGVDARVLRQRVRIVRGAPEVERLLSRAAHG